MFVYKVVSETEKLLNLHSDVIVQHVSLGDGGNIRSSGSSQHVTAWSDDVVAVQRFEVHRSPEE